jgi:hypothetical protein
MFARKQLHKWLVAVLSFLTLAGLADAAPARADRCMAWSFVKRGEIAGVGRTTSFEAAAIVMLGGGSGGAFDARVFADVGGQGIVDFGTVRPVSPSSDGDRMDAFFADGFLYVDNALYLPGECHACSTHSAVQRFLIRKPEIGPPTLVREGIAVVTPPTGAPAPCSAGLPSSWIKRVHDVERQASFAATATYGGRKLVTNASS